MDWNEYENLTKWIYETIGRANGVVIEGYGNDCKIQGNSGVEHQIDVLASHSDGFHKYQTDIECKYWNKNVDKDVVMKVKSIVDDCNFSKGIIVSKKGFTLDAIKYANHVGVDLVVLREPLDEDWKGRVKNICIQINALTPVVTSVNLGLSPLTLSNNINASKGNIRTASAIITFPDGKKENLEDYLQNTFCKDVRSENEDELLRYEFLQGTTYTTLDDGNTSYINYIEIKGHLSVSTSDFTILGDSYISFIMKNLSSGASLRITSDNKIIND